MKLFLVPNADVSA